MSHRKESRIYVGNLPSDVRTKDLEDIFRKFGKISYIDLKNRRGPPFAFVEFEDARDAEDAITRDGYEFDGYKLRVEFPRGRERGPGGAFISGSRDGRDRNRGPPSRRSKYRVIVTGLPPSGSWQDLKDHMREAGDVCFADVYRDGTGVVEFLHKDDMRYAIKKLHDSRFKSHEGEIAYVRVKEDNKRTWSRSRSRSRSHSRSFSRSKSKSRSRSGSRSSASGSHSRSVTRSRSRSRDRRVSPVYSPKKNRNSRSISRSRSRSRSAASSSRSRSRSPLKPKSKSNSKSKSYSRSKSRSKSKSKSPSPRTPRSRSPSRSPSKCKRKSRSRSPSTSKSSSPSNRRSKRPSKSSTPSP